MLLDAQLAGKVNGLINPIGFIVFSALPEFEFALAGLVSEKMERRKKGILRKVKNVK